VLRRGIALSLTCLLSTLTIAAAQTRGEWSVVQPPEARSELLLWSKPGQARVEIDGDVRSYSLATDEELFDIAETTDGWVAAGRRSSAGRSELFLVEDGGQGFRRLPLPAARGEAQQLRPALMVRDGRLDAIAWLEGATPAETSVRASVWSGADWVGTQTVSGPMPGSQAGLSSTVLRDGSGLLVWSAFDGIDDEVYFSRSRGDGWSPRKRLTKGNRVPDVAPAVIATRNGALAAWSRSNGTDYDLVIARYRRGGWTEPRVIARGGALFPRFARRDGGLYLLFRSAQPRGWGVIELGPNGGKLRQAQFLETDSPRPSIELNRSGVNLRWPFRPAERGYWGIP
jgi:hypothetical protein